MTSASSDLVEGAEPTADDAQSPEQRTAQPALVQEVFELRDRLTLTDVRTQRLSAEVLADVPLSVAAIKVSVADPEVLLEGSEFAVRLMQEVLLLDDRDTTLAYVEVAIVVSFTLAGDERPEEQVIALFVEHNVYFIAYPYLREAVQATTSRLGLDPVVLGTLSRDEFRPTEVTLVPRHAS